jgi:post-segregation antitoxin (ccd killing protein)
MARVNVYLPDELASRVKKADLNVSAIAQKALEEELAGRENNEWLARIRRLPPSGVSHDHVMAALDAARDEYDPR